MQAFIADIEKDFVVVPINGNIHCTGVSAARQRNRRKAKKEIKVLGGGLGYFSTQRLNCRGYQARLSALSNKETSEGEAEVEHEEDSRGLGDHGVR